MHVLDLAVSFSTLVSDAVQLSLLLQASTHSLTEAYNFRAHWMPNPSVDSWPIADKITSDDEMIHYTV
jgi:hypothetical protein